MRHAKPGMMEFELEAKFQYEIYAKGGCRKTAYTSICACGPNNAVLHYGHAAAPNDQQTKDSDMALLDMGAEYHGYVSDITCTFPLTGTFAPAQRIIYEGVLAAQRAVMEAAKPGVSWVDMHIAASREVLKAMLTLRVLSGSLDDLLTLGEYFYIYAFTCLFNYSTLIFYWFIHFCISYLHIFISTTDNRCRCCFHAPWTGPSHRLRYPRRRWLH